MDSLLPLLCLLLGIAIPLLVVGLVMRRGMHQLSAANTYRVVAERLGLSVDTRGISLQGHLDNRRIWIGGVMVGHGTERRTMTWGVVDLVRPLGLGLLVRRRGLSDRIFRRGRAPEIRLDDQELRRRLEVHGDAPEQVRRLLGPDVLAPLARLAARWPDVVLTDGSVRVHLKRPIAGPDSLHALVDAMLELARALEHARKRVAPPPRLATVAKAWEPLATDLGLELESWLPAMSGLRADRQVTVAAWRGERGYSATIRVGLRSGPELGLRIQPQRAPDGFWSVGQDIQLGDADFDNAFVVKGWDPITIRQVLDEETRETLLVAATSGELLVDDLQVRLRSVMLTPSEIRQAIRRCEDVAERLGR